MGFFQLSEYRIIWKYVDFGESFGGSKFYWLFSVTLNTAKQDERNFEFS